MRFRFGRQVPIRAIVSFTASKKAFVVYCLNFSIQHDVGVTGILPYYKKAFA